MSIQARFARGIRWLGAARLIGQIVSWVGTIYVMRLLAPTDYGLAAICSAVLMLASLIAEFGFGAAIVQAATLSRDQVRSVFGASLLFSALCAGFVALVAPLLGDFYRAPEAVPMIQVAMLTLVLSSLATLPDAYLRRDMAFARISIVEFCTGVVATLVTVALATGGAGVWSLIFGPVAGAVMRTVMAFAMARIWIAPSLHIGAARPLLSYGLKITVSRMASYVLGQSDVLIAGRVLAKSELGVYSIAMHLAMMPMAKFMGVLNSVAFPAIADLNRNEGDVLSNLLGPLRLIAHVVVPLLWGLAAVAPWLVPVLIGPAWSGAVLPLQIVCVALPVRLVGTLLATTLQGLGHAGLDLRNTLTGAVLLPICFAIGSLQGAEGLAAAWLVGLPLLLTVNLRRSREILGFGMQAVAKALLPSLLCSATMGAVVMLTGYALGASAVTVPGLIAVCVVGALCQMLLLWLCDRRSANALLEMLRHQSPQGA
ncbi:MAG: Lipopolysaccharide biosynthesis protein WzxC [Candidatus Accumulibacter appositus]|uniref:Lipopolysaccharide biosynthesis protein WzxC n=1 Tax=Candidatus Accumulibacter appositus TaxID=1454003 RepID=A0A011PJK1_9PROT|nr:lipopolysaccharide biosynthesis protein [Accumulibacter sp.]EXI77247.1 MAG: Lipopolysaccharide biosynthesis protein WzxC [Candidatus Accumulibacter appositus]HRF04001.1 lipopolysaccharide biosynthesis protein [Accumulibacter sp.]